MDKAISKDSAGQPGPEMKEVWLPNNSKFDDGVKEIISEIGSKAPKHSSYYTDLLEKHNRKNKFVCIDCGKDFPIEKKDYKIAGQLCSKCYKNHQEKRSHKPRRTKVHEGLEGDGTQRKL